MESNIFLLFDLDHTLWPFYTNLLSDNEFNELLNTFEFSKDVISVFDYIYKYNIPFGFVSRSKHYDKCYLLLEKLNIDLNSVPNVILWTPNKTKLPHIEQIIKEHVIQDYRILLFDDDLENLKSVEHIVYNPMDSVLNLPINLVQKYTCLSYKQFINALKTLI